MGKHKELTLAQIKEANAQLDREILKSEVLPLNKKFARYSSIFARIYNGLVSEDRYNYAVNGMNIVFVKDNYPKAITHAEIEALISKEDRFLIKIIGIQSVPLFAIREVSKYFLRNYGNYLNSGSRQQEVLKIRIKKKIKMALKNDKAERPAVGELPKGFLNDFIASEFYPEKFKTWLIGKKLIAGNKKSKNSVSDAYLLKAYLLLAEYLENLAYDLDNEDLGITISLRNAMKGASKTKKNLIVGIPKKDTRISKIIAKKTGLSPDQIDGRLAMILDPDR